MIILLAALAVLLLPVLLGGQLARLATLRLRGTGWLLAALLVQVLAIEVSLPHGWAPAVHLASYAVALGFLVANHDVPGFLIVGAGVLSNGVTIAVNGGTLPARAAALATAGLPQDALLPRTHGFVNSGIVDHPRLEYLGDVFAVPAGVPFANVFSVGDLLIVLGVAVLAWRVCGTHWTRPWNPVSSLAMIIDPLPGGTSRPADQPLDADQPQDADQRPDTDQRPGADQGHGARPPLTS